MHCDEPPTPAAEPEPAFWTLRDEYGRVLAFWSHADKAVVEAWAKNRSGRTRSVVPVYTAPQPGGAEVNPGSFAELYDLVKHLVQEDDGKGIEANTAAGRLALNSLCSFVAMHGAPAAVDEEANWNLFKASRYPENGDGSCRKCGFAPVLDHGFCEGCAQKLGFGSARTLQEAWRKGAEYGLGYPSTSTFGEETMRRDLSIVALGLDGVEADIERVLFRRVVQGRMEGYTLEAAHEIASILPGGAEAKELREALLKSTCDSWRQHGDGRWTVSVDFKDFGASVDFHNAIGALAPPLGDAREDER